MNINKSLDDVLEWVESKLLSGQEPPWARKEYSQLKESVLKIQKGRESVVLMEDLPESESHQESAHQQAENILQLDTFRHRRAENQVILPM